uniref:IS66 family transposase n=1 Tax=Escherichia coli TaxID=562 RepID=UPI00203E7800
LTEEALKRIGELYAIEAEIRGMTAEQRLAERQLKTKPLLKSLESWLRCQRQDYWPFFAIFNVRYWSLMLSAF